MGMIAEDLAVVCVEAVEPELVDWLTAKGIRIMEISYGDTMNMCEIRYWEFTSL